MVPDATKRGHRPKTTERRVNWVFILLSGGKRPRPIVLTKEVDKGHTRVSTVQDLAEVGFFERFPLKGEARRFLAQRQLQQWPNS
jgi:hypothetical protein